MQKKIVITGMSGLIGGLLRKDLATDYDLVAVNRRSLSGVRCFQADITDLQSIAPAFEGADVVIHLAALAVIGAPMEDTVAHNVIGTYNVFEAARQAGVSRIIFASSGAVVTGYELESPYRELAEGPNFPLPENWEMITHLAPPRPQGLYGCSKLWGESLGRMYSDEFGMSVLCVRIGAVRDADRPTNAREHAIWCSQRDIVQFMRLCITAPDDLKYDIFFAGSNNQRNYRDIGHARAVLGYEPQDSSDVFNEID